MLYILQIYNFNWFHKTERRNLVSERSFMCELIHFWYSLIYFPCEQNNSFCIFILSHRILVTNRMYTCVFTSLTIVIDMYWSRKTLFYNCIFASSSHLQYKQFFSFVIVIQEKGSLKEKTSTKEYNDARFFRSFIL